MRTPHHRFNSRHAPPEAPNARLAAGNGAPDTRLASRRHPSCALCLLGGLLLLASLLAPPPAEAQSNREKMVQAFAEQQQRACKGHEQSDRTADAKRDQVDTLEERVAEFEATPEARKHLQEMERTLRSMKRMARKMGDVAGKLQAMCRQGPGQGSVQALVDEFTRRNEKLQALAKEFNEYGQEFGELTLEFNEAFSNYSIHGGAAMGAMQEDSE